MGVRSSRGINVVFLCRPRKAAFMLLNPRTTEFLTRVSGKLLYGTIILMAVLGSLTYPLPNLTVIVTVIASLFAVVLAKTYSDTVYDDMKLQRLTPWSDIVKLILKQGWVMAGAAVPIFFFGLALVGVITQTRASRLTEVVLLTLLAFFGFISRRLSGGSVLQSLTISAVAAALGRMVVVVEVWAKYLPKVAP